MCKLCFSSRQIHGHHIACTPSNSRHSVEQYDPQPHLSQEINFAVLLQHIIHSGVCSLSVAAFPSGATSNSFPDTQDVCDRPFHIPNSGSIWVCSLHDISGIFLVSISSLLCLFPCQWSPHHPFCYSI